MEPEVKVTVAWMLVVFAKAAGIAIEAPIADHGTKLIVNVSPTRSPAVKAPLPSLLMNGVTVIEIAGEMEVRPLREKAMWFDAEVKLRTSPIVEEIEVSPITSVLVPPVAQVSVPCPIATPTEALETS
jgi:hypothetical protein